jgi:hypothetical protein
MEMFIISGYIAICIVVFTIFRIPLNRWAVPTASVGGVLLVFALIQVLNFYHPHSSMSRQHLVTTPVAAADGGQAADLPLTFQEPRLVAWFPQNSLLRLQQGGEAEVIFDSIPGKVFSGLVQAPGPAPGGEHDWARYGAPDTADAGDQTLIPVVIDITDVRYSWYASQLADGSRAQSVVYGKQHHELALVRQTLLRMSAWMNYLTLFS